MKQFITLVLLIISFLIQVNAQGTSDKPNIIFFSADDLNTNINPLGYTQAKTPNLDKLAEMGITFTNAHAPGVFCAPSRTAIMTGLHASTTGCYNTEVYHYDYPDLTPLHMAFSNNGYKAYGAGKLFHHRAGFMDPRGWEEFFARSQEIKDVGYETGYFGSDVPYPDPHPYSPYYTKTNNIINDGGFLEWGPIANEKAEEIPDAISTNWVCDLLQQEHTDPFFIGLGLYTPHYPNYAPQKYFDLYNRDLIQVPELKVDDLNDIPNPMRQQMINRSRIQQTLEDIDAVKDAIIGYLAAVSFADAMLGRVLDALEASAYKDNTLIIFWSDQGYHQGQKGNWGKHTLWQETSHVPLIFAGNGLPQNKKVNTTVSLIDMYPTLVDLCHLPVQKQLLDGESLISVLQDPASSTDRNVFLPSHDRGSYAVINKDWKYIYYNNGTEEFYDKNNDPNEWYNLAGDNSYRSIIIEMQKSAPAEFHPGATPQSSLELVFDSNGFYHWENKDKSKPAKFVEASVVFSDPITEKNIEFVENSNSTQESYTIQSNKAGQSCRYIQHDRHAYFKVSDQLFSMEDNEMMLELTYFDNGTNLFSMQYNSTSSVVKSIDIYKTNTNKWITKVFMVTDASFNNLQNNQADVRIGGEVYIRSLVIKKHIESLVSVTLTNNIMENGIEFLIGTDPNKETYTQAVTKEDNECRLIPTLSEKTKYGYFSVDNTLITNADNELVFEITYLDQGTTSLLLNYNSLNEKYEKLEIPKNNTNKWMTSAFYVNDAALNNLQNNQSDFRIRGTEYIRRIALRKGVDNEGNTSLSPEQELHSHMLVKVQPVTGGANISVSNDLIGADLYVYNLMGVLQKRQQVNQSEFYIGLGVPQGIYIFVVRSDNGLVSKKVLFLQRWSKSAEI